MYQLLTLHRAGKSEVRGREIKQSTGYATKNEGTQASTRGPGPAYGEAKEEGVKMKRKFEKFSRGGADEKPRAAFLCKKPFPAKR